MPTSELSFYLKDIATIPLLSKDEEIELAHRIRNGDGEARNHMVRSNLRLVINIAQRYAHMGLSFADLVSEGNLGLIRAAENFNPAFNTRFGTYATYWIKQALRRAITDYGKTIRLPAYLYDLVHKWYAAYNILSKDDEHPSDEAVAKYMEIPKKKIKSIKRAIRVFDLNHTQQREFLDMIPITENHEYPSEDIDLLKEWLGKLSKRHREVICCRFGINCEAMTLKATGNRYGLTRERIRQIETDALAHLREMATQPPHKNDPAKSVPPYQSNRGRKASTSHSGRHHSPHQNKSKYHQDHVPPESIQTP
jgi:RNA polymerase primary sigma factor